jgi:ABC-type transport system substrate-binding protein
MRVDVDGPLTDIRVRRALNIAVNQQDIISAYYKGNAALFAYPEHSNFGGYFEPFDAMPDSVKELFMDNPDQARKLLAEAGYPTGFSFRVMVCSCNAATLSCPVPRGTSRIHTIGGKIRTRVSRLQAVHFIPGARKNDSSAHPSPSCRPPGV